MAAATRSTTLASISKYRPWQTLPRDDVALLDPQRACSALLSNASIATGIAQGRQATPFPASIKKPKRPLVTVSAVNILSALQKSTILATGTPSRARVSRRKFAMCRAGPLKQEKLTGFSRATAVRMPADIRNLCWWCGPSEIQCRAELFWSYPGSPTCGATTWQLPRNLLGMEVVRSAPMATRYAAVLHWFDTVFLFRTALSQSGFHLLKVMFIFRSPMDVAIHKAPLERPDSLVFLQFSACYPLVFVIRPGHRIWCPSMPHGDNTTYIVHLVCGVVAK